MYPNKEVNKSFNLSPLTLGHDDYLLFNCGAVDGNGDTGLEASFFFLLPLLTPSSTPSLEGFRIVLLFFVRTLSLCNLHKTNRKSS